MGFWRNPELVRYVRADLRAPRALTAAMLVGVICGLIGLFSWGIQHPNVRAFFEVFYTTVLVFQYVGGGLGVLLTCGQALSRERALKTYDFLRTTRLTAAELTAGKLVGSPILISFCLLCSLPVSIPLGVLAGHTLATLFWTYALLVVFALFLGLVALWGSMLTEGRATNAFVFLILVFLWIGTGFTHSPLRGLGAMSAYPALASLYGVEFGRHAAPSLPFFFGRPVSYLFLSFFLYGTFGAWFTLMLVRNIKRETAEIRLLSRWQAIGLAAFLNLLFYALLDSPSPGGLVAMALSLNALLLYGTGLAMLTPHEKLKVWWRRRAAGAEGYFSDNGLPWPWMLVVALVGYSLLIGYQFLASRAGILGGPGRIGHPFDGPVAIQFLIWLVFAVRDVLFLQWANLTRMRRPQVKAVLYLALYYVGVSIIGNVLAILDNAVGLWVLRMAAPYHSFALLGDFPSGALPVVSMGLAIQVALSLVLLLAIARRLSRPARLPAASPA